MFTARTDLGCEICVDRTIGKYEVVTILATGSSCVVARVRDTKSGQYFACKIVSRSDLVTRGVLLPFEQELRIMQTVRHRNLISTVDVIYGEQYIYVIMEEYPNGDLLTVVCNEYSRSNVNVRRIFYQVASAVGHLHSKDISHLDIKPDNVLLDKLQNAKLADFGCCRVRSCPVRFNNVGTLYYSAPEIFDPDTIVDSHKCDIWSLGVLLFTISSGKFPWSQGTDEEVIDQIRRAQIIIPPDMDPYVASMVIRCTVKEPELRPAIDDILSDPWFMKAGKPPPVDGQVKDSVKQSQTMTGSVLRWRQPVVIVRPRIDAMNSAMRMPVVKPQRSVKSVLIGEEAQALFSRMKGAPMSRSFDLSRV